MFVFLFKKLNNGQNLGHNRSFLTSVSQRCWVFLSAWKVFPHSCSLTSFPAEPLVLLPALHVVRCVVGRWALGCTDVAFTRSLKAKDVVHRLRSCGIQAALLRVMGTCAMIRASSSCPLPLKKVTSFLISPVATQYGMASSLSSAISCSALLQHQPITITNASPLAILN